MFNSRLILDAHQKNFLLVTEENATLKRQVTDHEKVLEMLSSELEIMHLSLNHAHEQLQQLLEINNVDVNMQYTLLKESHKKLEDEIIALKEKINLLQIQHSTEISEIKEHLERIKSRSENEVLEEVNKLKEMLKQQKIQFEEKERTLYNELQASQAAAAIQYDDMESNYKAILSDVNLKLRHSNDTCNTLRVEIFNLKSQRCSTSSTHDDKSTYLEEKLRNTEEQLRLAKETIFKMSENFGSNFELATEKLEKSNVFLHNSTASAKSDFCLNKFEKFPEGELKQKQKDSHSVADSTCQPPYQYEPLHVKEHKYLSAPLKKNSISTDIVEQRKTPPVIATKSNVPVYKTKGRGFKQRGKTFLPSLKPTTAANTFNCNTKKRKLYNPNDQDYLEENDK